MISGIGSAIFGVLAIVLSLVFIAYAIAEPFWPAAALAALFLWGGLGWLRDGIYWLKLVPQSRLRVTGDRLFIRNQDWPYKEVLHIGWSVTKTPKRVNFVHVGDDWHVTAFIETPDGRFNFRAGQGPATWMNGSLGEKDSGQLLEKLEEIDRLSFPYRATRAIKQLEEDGYWIYAGKRFDSEGNVRIGGNLIPLKRFGWTKHQPYELVTEKYAIPLIRDRSVFLFMAKTYFKVVWAGLSTASR